LLVDINTSKGFKIGRHVTFAKVPEFPARVITKDMKQHQIPGCAVVCAGSIYNALTVTKAKATVDATGRPAIIEMVTEIAYPKKAKPTKCT